MNAFRKTRTSNYNTPASPNLSRSILNRSSLLSDSPRRDMLKRELGSRQVSQVLGAYNKRKVATQQNQMAILTVRSMRKLKSSHSVTTEDLDDDEELDEEILHFLCKEAAELMGYDTSKASINAKREKEQDRKKKKSNPFAGKPPLSAALRRPSPFSSEELLPDLSESSGSDFNDSFKSEISTQSSGSPDLIQVSPGQNLPLIGSDETNEAILSGRVTITACTRCQSDLTCVDHADLVICPECWVFSPVDQSAEFHTGMMGNPRVVGLGVTTEMVNIILAAAMQE